MHNNNNGQLIYLVVIAVLAVSLGLLIIHVCLDGGINTVLGEKMLLDSHNRLGVPVESMRE